VSAAESGSEDISGIFFTGDTAGVMRSRAKVHAAAVLKERRNS
jgi:hypothetical protein